MVSILNKRRRIALLFIVIIVLMSAFISADGILPGSEADPIVTQSFVEQKIEQVKYYIDTYTNNLSNDNTKLASEIEKLKLELSNKDKSIAELKMQLSQMNSPTKFEVVKLQKDQILIAGEGAEIIPRSGKMIALYGENGGLSDITSAKDLKTNESIVLNHMLIASRNDGRGIKAVSEVFLLIKGSYILK